MKAVAFHGKNPTPQALPLALGRVAYVMHQQIRQHARGRLSVMHAVQDVETPLLRHAHPVDLNNRGPESTGR